ncbi:MAG: CHAT domain-containing protein [Chloroflexales bacterium]|nr:CHAT domain-containing protein [Chloroflexales bacterium]
MDETADLELSLHAKGGARYAVDVVFSRPDSQADTRPLKDREVFASFDPVALRELEGDPAAYGALLGQMLFADPRMATAFAQARAVAASSQWPLRLRLNIADDARELHDLHWEKLRDPADQLALALSERVLFARALGSADWRPVALRPKEALRALVLIAGQDDLGTFNLAPIDVAAERQRALAGLGVMRATILAGRGQPALATMLAQLRRGCDILYLVAHGAVVDGEPWLYLDDGRGGTARVAGSEIVSGLIDLPAPPRLIILASCASAGDASRGALSALGPRLAAAGIPAVIAMQGPLSIETNARLMPAFFRELGEDGRIDRALVAARQAVADQPDWWAMALFTRLRSGRIWYEPGFADDRRGRGDEKWEPLLASIRDEECTPIIGPDLAEGMIGSRRDLARHLADKFHFPLAPEDREGLPQVTQFLAFHKSLQFLPVAVLQYFVGEIQRRYKDGLPCDEAVDPEKLGRKELMGLLNTLLDHAWRQRSADPAEPEPHCVLAALKVPIYVSADPSDLLVNALRARGKAPEVVLCPWNDDARQATSVYTSEPDYDPTLQRPLVYQLFGSYQRPDSLVLTEDQHFDYLIGVTQNKDLVPSPLRSRLADTALLFLGFRADDWGFRTFLRSLISQAGGSRRDHYAHISAQIAPEEGRNLSPALAQRYLEDYFSKSANVSIYWGSADDFIRDLARKL